MYVAWARLLGHEFEHLTAAHHRTLIGHYGATNPADFFAVATETFFEKPQQLRPKHPELYQQLQEFYCQPQRRCRVVDVVQQREASAT